MIRLRKFKNPYFVFYFRFHQLKVSRKTNWKIPFVTNVTEKIQNMLKRDLIKEKKTIIKLDCIITHKCTGTNTGIQLYNAVINKEYTVQQLKQRAVNDKLT